MGRLEGLCEVASKRMVAESRCYASSETSGVVIRV